MNTENNEHRDETPASQHPLGHSEGGYGSPTPEDEMPADSSTNPGSPDPTLRGQESDAQALDHDESLGAPDRNFFQDEDAGSDGEPGAGRLGGTDEQFLEELDRSEVGAAHIDPADETPLETPSTEIPLTETNSGPTRTDRESFSSETEDDAAGGE